MFSNWLVPTCLPGQQQLAGAHLQLSRIRNWTRPGVAVAFLGTHEQPNMSPDQAGDIVDTRGLVNIHWLPGTRRDKY